MSYRNKIELYFKKNNILNEFNYDFNESIDNNNKISCLSECISQTTAAQ